MENDALKNELNVIGKIGDLLKLGVFQGTHAQDVAIAQMYIQGLYKNLQAHMSELKNKPVETKASPAVIDSIKPSDVANAGAMQ